VKRWFFGASSRAGAVAILSVGVGLIASSATSVHSTEAGAGTQTWITRRATSSMASTFLSAVSCTSAETCTAVGDYSKKDHKTEFALAEAWNGARWAIEATPDPSGADVTTLNSVACASPDTCTAVGSYSKNDNKNQFALSESWNGERWEIMSTPYPIRSVESYLAGVQCLSATACTAVGSSSTSTNVNIGSTLVEVWDGARWTIVPTPNPPGAHLSSLHTVSCSSVASCIAVGAWSAETERKGSVPLIETWDGGYWTIQFTPRPRGAMSTYLSGLSCSSHVCMAVGNSIRTAADETVAEYWNGDHWTLVSKLSPNGDFSAVSCVSTSACQAVGDRDSATGTPSLAESWTGGSWKVEATPNPRPNGTLSGVSCTKATACMAVGASCGSASICAFPGLSDSTALAETWNGIRWSVAP
jgi:hypothetical protein